MITYTNAYRDTYTNAYHNTYTVMHSFMHSIMQAKKPKGALTGCCATQSARGPRCPALRTGRGGGDGRRLVARLGFCEEPRLLTPPRPVRAASTRGCTPMPPWGRSCEIRDSGASWRQSRAARNEPVRTHEPLTASRRDNPTRQGGMGSSAEHPSCPPARAG
jgi:hypothetical protein